MVEGQAGSRRVSWTQGVCEREDLPAKFLTWADTRKGAPLQYITWFGNDPPIILDYGRAGALETAMGWPEFSAILNRLDSKTEAA